MKLSLLISIPLISALIGWVTNWVAVRMLFRPRKPLTLLGMTWQGLIPRRQPDLAVQTAEIIESEFLQQHTIRELVKTTDFSSHMERFVGALIETRLKPKLSAIPFIGGFVNDQTIAMVKEMGIASVREEMPTIMEQMATDIESRIQVREMVEKRMNALDLDKLEAIVLRVAKKEFRRIEQLGAVLGFFVGLGQVILLILLY